MDIRGKTAIVTGGARIGQAVARSLKDLGANLVLTYVSSESKVAPLGYAVRADLSVEEDVKKVVPLAMDKFGRVDILVHMASVYDSLGWEQMDKAAWDRGMKVDAESAFLLGKAAADAMRKNSADDNGIRGKIVYFTDWSLQKPYVQHTVYNVAKAAVLGLTWSFAKALAPDILVNAIAPGPILKPPTLSEEENKEVLAGTLLRRWGRPEDIAKGVCFLLDNDFVTGTKLTIDGGRTLV